MLKEQWLEFLSLLTNNEYYRAGFFMALVAVGLGLAGWWLLFRTYAQWLKMRQFFEPIKKPGKVPVETGPSPAGMLLGCLVRIAFIVLLFAIGAVVWYGLTPEG